MCETVRSMSNRAYQLITVNGQVDTRENQEEGGQPTNDGDGSAQAPTPQRRYNRDYTDPHKMNLPGPSGTLLERMSPPLNLDEGIDTSRLVALLPVLCDIMHHNPEQSIGIRSSEGGDVVVIPCSLIFDGTPLCGNMSIFDTADRKRLVGSTIKVDLPKVDAWLQEAAGLSADDKRAFWATKIRELTDGLHRGVDGYHLQLLGLSISFHVGDFYHPSASYSSPLKVGDQVEAQRGTGQRYNPCEIIATNHDGTVDVKFSFNGAVAPRLTTDHIRNLESAKWREVLRDVQSALHDCQKCYHCLKNGLECIIGCEECSRRGMVCDRCERLGFKSIIPERRRCSECQRAGCRCLRFTIYIVVSDKESCNKKALEHLITLIRQQSSIPVRAVFGIQHTAKGSRAGLINWHLCIAGHWICITDLIHLWVTDHNELTTVLTKEPLLYKDRQNTDWIYAIYSILVREKIADTHVKGTIYPEPFCAWRAEFQGKAQDLFEAEPEYVAFSETGFVVVSDPGNGVLLGGRLSNPVEFGVIAGQPGKFTPRGVDSPRSASASTARFSRLAGVDFLNSTGEYIIIAADRDAGNLRVLQLKDEKVFTTGCHSNLGWRPTGVATINRFDTSSDAKVAFVGVTSEEEPDIYLVKVSICSSWYEAEVTRVILTGAATAPGLALAISGITAQAAGPVHISVLKKRRDSALRSATSQHARILAHAAYSSDTAVHNSMVVYVGRRSEGSAHCAALMRVDLSDRHRPRTKRDIKEVDCPGSIVVSELKHDPFDLTVDCDGRIYVSSIESARLLRALPPTDGSGEWRIEVAAGPQEEPSPDESGVVQLDTADGEVSKCSFSGIAGIAAYQAGCTIFGLEYETRSLFKIVNMGAFVRWAELWMLSFAAFGERDPGSRASDKEHPSWDAACTSLREAAEGLRAIDRERKDAVGLEKGEGPEGMMCSGSLAAHIDTSVPSMELVGDHLRGLDPWYSPDTRSSTEKPAERHWAVTRVHTQDSAFDQCMYVQLVPRIFIETLKQITDVGFVYETTDRKIDEASYSMKNLALDFTMQYATLMGTPHHRPLRIAERTGPRGARALTGRIIANGAGIWGKLGQVFRFERRTDLRRLAKNKADYQKQSGGSGGALVLAADRAEEAFKQMRLISRSVARLRETKLRDRMRQTLGMASPRLEPERLTVDHERCIDDEPRAGSAAAHFPLLLKGELVAVRQTGARGGPNVGWTLAQVQEDFSRPAVLTIGCLVAVRHTVWRATDSGFVVPDVRQAPTHRVVYGGFFRVKANTHRSGLIVVNPRDADHTTSQERVFSLDAEQMEYLNRVARLDAARPDWQHEWWLPILPDSEGPQWNGGRAVDLHTRENERVDEEPDGDINPNARRSRRARHRPIPLGAPPTATPQRGCGTRGHR